MRWHTPFVLTAALAAALAAGCSAEEEEAEEAAPTPGESVCVGKCDGVDEPANAARYTLDLDAANRIWGGAAQRAADLYSVTISLPNGLKIQAATHMFGQAVNPIPYHDDDGEQVTDAAGQPVFQGDAELARFFGPGQIGYAIKHHRPEKPTLDFGALASGGGASASALKEDMKLQDTHIELVVGVRRPLGDQMVDGVITLNNPQNYQSGRFGDEVYSMVFVRPAYPDYAPAETHRQFNDNIRTMMLGFNAVSTFPGDYNGGDPLAASDTGKVREHVRQMVLAIAGEGSAAAASREFFKEQKNLIYCAELAHVATSAGLLVPLNRAGLVDSGLVDDATYDRFARLVDDHNSGNSTPFTELNRNPLAAHVNGTMAPDGLQPLAEYGAAEERSKLAFRPLTMAEIVEGFLKTHIPRSDPRLGGEALAPVQAAVLEAMQPGLYEAMGMDDSLMQSMVTRARDTVLSLEEDLADPELSEARRVSTQAEIEVQHRRLAEAQAQLAGLAQKRAVVDQVFQAVLQVVGTQYEDYDTFRAALGPVMAQARQLTGPRDDSGVGYFVPPSALHLVALGCPGDTRCGGLIGLDYVGHGVHVSAVKVNQPPPEPAPFAVVGFAEAMPKPSQDHNMDGETDSRQDEYVLIVNTGTAEADLSGWKLYDNVKLRFEFADGYFLPVGGSAIIYGGGGAELVGIGGLGLNDNGDTLTLKNANGDAVDTMSWTRVESGQLVEGSQSANW